MVTAQFFPEIFQEELHSLQVAPLELLAGTSARDNTGRNPDTTVHLYRQSFLCWFHHVGCEDSFNMIPPVASKMGLAGWPTKSAETTASSV